MHALCHISPQKEPSRYCEEVEKDDDDHLPTTMMSVVTSTLNEFQFGKPYLYLQLKLSSWHLSSGS